MMLSLIKPKYFMPMHGDYRMLKIHSETAQSVGLPRENVFVCKNGEQIFLKNGKAWKGNYFEVRPVYIGRDLNSEDTLNTLRERQLMLKNGVLSVVILIDSIQRKILHGPNLLIRGSFYLNKERQLTEKIHMKLTKDINDYLRNNKFEKKTLNNLVKERLAAIIYEMKKINPLIMPLILENRKRN